MKARKIAHVGIAVEDVDAALGFYRDALGLQHEETVELPERGLRIAFLLADGVLVELMEPMGPESEISQFLATRGPGIHHLCFEVDDIAGMITQLKEHGTRMVNETPEIGAEGLPVAFVHPRSAHGVLVEILEKAGGPASPATE